MFKIKNKKSTIGVDISDLNLKAVQLVQSGHKIKIQGLSRIDLPKGIIERGQIKDKQVFISAVHDLLTKTLFGSFNTDQIVACLPETRSFIKLITVEKGANPLESIIEAEIEKYVPLSASEMYYDWQIIKEQNEDYQILIGAAPQQITNQYIDALKSAKLDITALEIEAMPICRCLLMEESPKYNGSQDNAYGIIDIGAKRTSLIVYASNTIAFTLSMPISGEEITEKIANALDINRDQAEKAKIICGLDKNNARGIIHDILSDMIQDLTNRLIDALNYYGKNYPGWPAIKKMIVCGGGANIKSLTEILTAALQIEVVKGNPFINISETEENFGKHLVEIHNIKDKKITNINNKLSITQSASVSYSTAIGLSLRHIFLVK
ncbi:MAG: type IV pilus assembly protein PilM [Candidatus Falkowbacteria bacterium]|nr:type IV pilus assembly protein PilM [Candidatus Falkowbacteria bacterium]